MCLMDNGAAIPVRSPPPLWGRGGGWGKTASGRPVIGSRTNRSGTLAVMAIGRLMQTVPELTEIDVNPLMVHAKGKGATALDALIVV